jgi:GT2 family glycosyltransferase
MSKIDRPAVSVVLGTYNRRPFLEAAIDSVRASRMTAPYEIIVVDGGSDDGTMEWLIRQRDIVTIIQHNRVAAASGASTRKRSWGYFMNLGFKCAQARTVCLVSDDSVVHPDTIANGLAQFDRDVATGKRVGAVVFPWRSWPEEDGYRVCMTIGDNLMANYGLFNREAIAEVGWIEEERYSFYHADADLSLKLRHAGYAIDICEQALLEHYERAGVELRQGNLATDETDWKALTAHWRGIFFDPADPKPGHWLKLDGIAAREAAHLFPPGVRGEAHAAR